MTNQEVFDISVNHLRKQGRKSSAGKKADDITGIVTDDCRYRLKDGDTILMCAAGPFIPDEVYNEKMEGKGPWGLKYKKVYEFPGINVEFLGGLQEIHDGCEVAEWESEWEEFAKKNNVVYTPPTLSE